MFSQVQMMVIKFPMPLQMRRRFWHRLELLITGIHWSPQFLPRTVHQSEQEKQLWIYLWNKIQNLLIIKLGNRFVNLRFTRHFKKHPDIFNRLAGRFVQRPWSMGELVSLKIIENTTILLHSCRKIIYVACTIASLEHLLNFTLRFVK